MIITDWLHTPSASQTPVEMKKFSLRLDDVVFKVEDLSRQERRTEAETKRVGGQESGFLPPGNKIHCRVIRSYNVYLRIAAKWEKAVLKNKSVLHCWFLQCLKCLWWAKSAWRLRQQMHVEWKNYTNHRHRSQVVLRPAQKWRRRWCRREVKMNVYNRFSLRWYQITMEADVFYTL